MRPRATTFPVLTAGIAVLALLAGCSSPTTPAAPPEPGGAATSVGSGPAESGPVESSPAEPPAPSEESPSPASGPTEFSNDAICAALMSVDPAGLLGAKVGNPKGDGSSSMGACEVKAKKDKGAHVDLAVMWGSRKVAENTFDVLVDKDDTEIPGMGEKASYSTVAADNYFLSSITTVRMFSQDFFVTMTVWSLDKERPTPQDVLVPKFISALDQLGIPH